MAEGTAVVKQSVSERVYDALAAPSDPFENRRQAFELATTAARDQMISKMQRAVAAQTWGNSLPNPELQKAFCEWALAKGIDPALHVNILGGNVYLNAAYYLERLSAHPGYKHSRSLIVAPVSRRKMPEEIFDEKNRTKLMKHEMKVNVERYMKQIELEIPPAINNFPDSAAACLVFIEMKDGSVFEAWRAAGSYGRKSLRNANKPRDPVGDQAPQFTAETRAYRACCKKLPGWADYIGETDEALAKVEDLVEEARQQRKEREAQQQADEDRIELIADMQVEIDDLLSREADDVNMREACRDRYEDWIAGGFQNISIEMVQELLDALRRAVLYPGKRVKDPVLEELAEASVIEDVVDAETGEVIESEPEVGQ